MTALAGCPPVFELGWWAIPRKPTGGGTHRTRRPALPIRVTTVKHGEEEARAEIASKIRESAPKSAKVIEPQPPRSGPVFDGAIDGAIDGRRKANAVAKLRRIGDPA